MCNSNGSDSSFVENCDHGCSDGNCVEACVDDGYESNDIDEDAMIVSGGTTSGLAMCAVAEPDWYRIWVTSGDELTVTINFTNSICDLNIDLYEYDSDGDDWDMVDYSFSTSSNSETVSHTATITRDLRWRVVDNSCEGSYSMDVSIDECSPSCPACRTTTVDDGCYGSCSANCDTECSGSSCVEACVDDGYESNDIDEDAMIVSGGTTSGLAMCAVAEPDWYRIWVTSGDELTVTINFTNSICDLNIDLYEYDSDGDDWDMVDYSFSTSSNSETVSHTATNTRDLRWRVVANSCEGSYSMDVNID